MRAIGGFALFCGLAACQACQARTADADTPPPPPAAPQANPAALAAGGSSAPTPKFDEAALAQLREGKVIFGPDNTVYVIIPAPVDYVWRYLDDIEHWPVIWGDIRMAKLVGKAGRYVEYSFVTKSPVGDKRYTLVFSRPGPRRLEWFLDKSQPADFSDTHGFWELKPHDGNAQTLAFYRGQYDAWWFPGIMQHRLAEGVVAGLRRFILQHPKVAGK